MSKEAKLVITAEDHTKQAFASLQCSLGGVQQYLGSFKAKLLSLVGVTGFGAMIHGALEAGEYIEKLSTRLGASTEALSQYQHVAELSNVSFDSLTRGWQLMTKNVSEAAIGIDKASGILQELLNARPFLSYLPYAPPPPDALNYNCFFPKIRIPVRPKDY